MPEQERGFYIAPFGIDGEPEGMDYWNFERLSRKWLAICDRHLELHGPSFDSPWGGNIAHIQMKFTSISGTALITFSIHGKPAASVAIATGNSPLAEAEVIKMFVDSLRGTMLVQHAAAAATPFQNMLVIKERPLMIVVPWPDSDISEQDHALVRELAIHTAAAFVAHDRHPPRL
jgi:hypothetical protein